MSPAALLAVGIMLAAAFATRKPKRRPAAKPAESNDYVGYPGYVWPLQDYFPTQMSILSALGQLGYDVDLNDPRGVVSGRAVLAVAKFEADFNLVELVLGKAELNLVVNGLVEPPDLQAFVDAFALEEVFGQPWPSVVQTAELTAPGVA